MVLNDLPTALGSPQDEIKKGSGGDEKKERKEEEKGKKGGRGVKN